MFRRQFHQRFHLMRGARQRNNQHAAFHMPVAPQKRTPINFHSNGGQFVAIELERVVMIAIAADGQRRPNGGAGRVQVEVELHVRNQPIRLSIILTSNNRRSTSSSCLKVSHSRSLESLRPKGQWLTTCQPTAAPVRSVLRRGAGTAYPTGRAWSSARTVSRLPLRHARYQP